MSGVIFVTADRNEAGAKPAPNYSQVVDNTDPDRFESDGHWGTSSYGKGVNGEDYRFARPTDDTSLARFKVQIPEDGEYAIYARWPKAKGLNRSVPIGVRTASGVEWTWVDQRKNGGRWVKLGVFEMEAGDDYSVRISRETAGKAYVGADAVKVEQVSARRPASVPEEQPKSSNSTRSEEPTSSKGEEVVEKAREWTGTAYRLGGASRAPVWTAPASR